MINYNYQYLKIRDDCNEYASEQAYQTKLHQQKFWKINGQNKFKWAFELLSFAIQRFRQNCFSSPFELWFKTRAVYNRNIKTSLTNGSKFKKLVRFKKCFRSVVPRKSDQHKIEFQLNIYVSISISRSYLQIQPNTIKRLSTKLLLLKFF